MVCYHNKNYICISFASKKNCFNDSKSHQLESLAGDHSYDMAPDLKFDLYPPEVVVSVKL